MQREFRVVITLLLSVMMASSESGSLAKKWRSILLYRVNSTFLGSTKMNFTSAGCFLYSREVITALRPTDFPWPVAPAMSRWGILARSTTKVSLLIVLPKAMGSSISAFWNLLEAMTDRMDTTVAFLLGTSIPTVPLPGMGAMILMPNAASESAMSSSRFLILEILIPASGTISYKVTVGPMVALIWAIPIL